MSQRKAIAIRSTQLVLAVTLLLLLAGAFRAQARELLPSAREAVSANSITLLNPTLAPPSGWARGQRLVLRAAYDLPHYFAGPTPNVRLCFYANDEAGAAAISLLETAPQGLSKINYTRVDPPVDCKAAPYGSTAFGELKATFTAGSDVFDQMDFAVRVSSVTQFDSLALTVQAQEIESSFGAWVAMPSTSMVFSLAQPPQAMDPVYAANDSAACAAYSPCYVNSGISPATGSDPADGIGTGLKDAVDSLASNTVAVVGDYSILSTSVLVNHPLTIQSVGEAAITYTGAVCAEPMLRLTERVTLQSLNVNSGSCAAPARDLVSINSPGTVYLYSDDLKNGGRGVVIEGTGNVVIKHNAITGNSGLGVEILASHNGNVTIEANNLDNNNGGAGNLQIKNSADLTKGTYQANHNFLGSNATDNVEVSNAEWTSFDFNKRLGAAILENPNSPGVQAQEMPVGTIYTPVRIFGEFQARRADGTSDATITVVNHGHGSPANVPFLGGGIEALAPCTNYYDIYINSIPADVTRLDLSFFYGGDSLSCITRINSLLAGGGQIPIFWLNPAGGTNTWDNLTTTGQSVSADTAAQILVASIDATGNPNLIDLGHTPFVVGLAPLANWVNLQNFTASPGDLQVLLQWQTNSETGVSGFYVLRSDNLGGPFTRVSSFIPARGSPTMSALYSIVDPFLTNNTTYYYQLEAIYTNATSEFFGPVSVIPNPPTPTPTPTMTFTPTNTRTLTPTITFTPTITMTPTITETPTRTRTLIPTWTPRPTATYYYYRSPTPYTYRSPTTAYYPAPATNTPTRTLTLSSYYTGSLTPSASITISGSPNATLNSSGTPRSWAYPAPGNTTLTVTPGAQSTSTTPTAAVTPQSSATTTPIVKPIHTTGDGGNQAGANRFLEFLGLLVGLILGGILISLGGWFALRQRHILS